jgi:predicted amidohydrolase YtcJ
MRETAAVLLLLPLLACGPKAADTPAADLVVRGGTIVTLETPGSAEALAVSDGRIVAIGTAAEIEPWIGPATEIFDLAGATAIPGFIDSHAHLWGVGQQQLLLDLRDARSWEDVIERCRQAAAQAGPGALVVGRGWHQDKFETPLIDPVDGWPRHDALSAATPNNPVVLEHASGHATFANAAAMAVAGIVDSTADPDGGTIIRDQAGKAVGVFVETAANLLPSADGTDPARLVELGQREALENGITTFVDAGTTVVQARVLRELADRGALQMRLAVLLRDDTAAIAAAMPELRLIDYQGMLTIRGIKNYVDGALGSRGAWLLAPYSDAPETSGLNTTSLADLETEARLAKEHDLQLAIHAIGDRGNREVLDLFQRVLADDPNAGSRRWRIEHAQHLDPAEIPRFAAQGVIASMQGIHCTSDGPWVPQRIGEDRARHGAYVWHSLIEAGAVVANGTDAPVEHISPIASYAASVTRLMANGEKFFPEQSMTREEALRSYTLNGAYAIFAEADRGSLAIGKLADITVLDANPLTVAEEELPRIGVVATIVGGNVRYRK